MRFIRSLLAALILVTSLAVIAPDARSIAAEAASNMPLIRGNSARVFDDVRGTSRVGLPGAADEVGCIGSRPLCAAANAAGTELWRFTTGDAVLSSPTVADGVVYVGSWDDNLYAIDAETGAERWRFATGRDVTSSPAVVDGVVYVGSYDGNLYAIDAATGTMRWRFTTDGTIFSSPAVAEGVVYVGSRDDNLYAVDAAIGTERWRFATEDDVDSSPVVVDGVVYVGSDDGNLYAVDAARGAERWRFSRGGQSGWNYSAVAVADGVVYVGSVDDSLYAVDAASGAERWRFTTGDSVDSSPVVVDGVVFFGSDDDSLYAVDAATGAGRWRFATGGDVESSPAVVDGVVYVGSWDNNLYAVDAATGAEQWRFTTGGGVASSPAVVDGVVYIGSRDQQLYAIGAQEPVRRTVQSATVPTQQEVISLVLATAAIAGGNLPVGLTTPTLIDDPHSALNGVVPDDALAAQSIRFEVRTNAAAETTLTFSVYGSAGEARAAFDLAPQMLLRAGWQPREPTGIEPDATCLTLQTSDRSEAVCYVLRDEVIITAYSMLPLQAIDAVYLNANDLARFGSDIYDEVERP